MSLWFGFLLTLFGSVTESTFALLCASVVVYMGRQTRPWWHCSTPHIGAGEVALVVRDPLYYYNKSMKNKCIWLATLFTLSRWRFDYGTRNPRIQEYDHAKPGSVSNVSH